MKMIPEEILRSVSKSDALSYTLSLGRMTVWEYLVAKGVALDGHFVFSGDGHGDKYINVRDLDTITLLVPIAMQMAWEVHDTEFDAVIGTPHGADTLAVLVAYYYEQITAREIPVLKLLSGDSLAWYKDHGERARGLRILQIEDVINSAGSLCKSIKFIQDSGGSVISFCTVCNRRSDKNPGLSALAQRFDLKQAIALVEIDVVNHAVDQSCNPIEQCPFCAEGMTLNTRVGHGAKFLMQIEDEYPDLYEKLVN